MNVSFSEDVSESSEKNDSVLSPEAKEVKKTEISKKSVDYSEKFHFVFEEGAVFASVTRLQEESGRSNFVWNNRMIGMFFVTRLNNLFSFDIYARTEGLYPFLHTFNGMEVFAKQTILYAFDEFVGVPFRFNKFKYFTFELIPGGHLMYQLSDEYHLFYFGGGIVVGGEVPVANRWTVLFNGTFTCDYPNLGSNKLIQPFDLSWHWQTSFGIRYSKKMTNKYSILEFKKNKKNSEVTL